MAPGMSSCRPIIVSSALLPCVQNAIKSSIFSCLSISLVATNACDEDVAQGACKHALLLEKYERILWVTIEIS